MKEKIEEKLNTYIEKTLDKDELSVDEIMFLKQELREINIKEARETNNEKKVEALGYLFNNDVFY